MYNDVYKFCADNILHLSSDGSLYLIKEANPGIGKFFKVAKYT